MTWLEQIGLIWLTGITVFLIGWARLNERPEITPEAEFIASCEQQMKERAS